VATALAPAREPVYRQGTYSLRLTQEACEQPELALALETEGIPPARIYFEEQGGRRAIGCWVRDVGGDISTLSAGGTSGTVPSDWFKPAPGS
jgi:hypothetical protein